MDNTPNLELEIRDPGDKFNIRPANRNFEKIDTFAGEARAGLGNANGRIDETNERIDDETTTYVFRRWTGDNGLGAGSNTANPLFTNETCPVLTRRGNVVTLHIRARKAAQATAIPTAAAAPVADSNLFTIPIGFRPMHPVTSGTLPAVALAHWSIADPRPGVLTADIPAQNEDGRPFVRIAGAATTNAQNNVKALMSWITADPPPEGDGVEIL